MRRFRFHVPTAAGFAAALLLAGCQYSFSNPAERLQAGEISGRTLADPMAQGTPHPTGGIAVSLKGSSFDVVTHDTGRFTLLPLPEGQHTLLFRRGTQLALVRRVQVSLGSNGQPSGVALGDVSVPFAGVIAGTITDFWHGGVVVDEVTGLTSPAGGGDYRIDGVSLGDHRLKVGLTSAAENAEWVGGPIDLTLSDEAQSSVTQAALVAVHEATGTGRLRLRVVSLAPDIAPADVTVTLEDYVHGPLAGVPAPDAQGLVDLDVPEGVYWVRIAAPPAHAAEVTVPDPATAVVLQGEVADLGSLYVVPPGVPRSAQLACQTADDCGGSPCTGGACANWSPPPFVPAGVPFCYWRNDFCAILWSCQTPGGQGGQCLPANFGAQACVPCDTRCTVDGSTLLQAPPQGPVSPTGQCG